VGPFAAWGPGEQKVVEAHGSNGECVAIPDDAIGLSLNVTALSSSTQTFLTFWPDGPIPLAASLNPAPGEPPTPNAVTTQLSPTGSFRIYNDTGNVQIVLDVNGYYTTSPIDSLVSRTAALESRAAALESRATAAENASTALTARVGAAEIASTTLASRVASTESRLDALEQQQPFALSTNVSIGPSVIGLDVTAASLTATAPANGHFVVASTLTLYDDHPTAVNGCSITTGAMTDSTYDQAVQMSSTGGDLANLAGVRRFDVTAGQVITFNLVCERFIFGPSSGSADLSDIVLVASYFPAP
jgi:hypothetical protein